MSVLGGNLTQTLFNDNMQAVTAAAHGSGSQAARAFREMKSITELTEVPDDMEELMPAFVQQANLSTYYQSNPWQILTESSKYGLDTMGGKLNLEQPPGYRPGNILVMPKPAPSQQKVAMAQQMPARALEPIDPDFWKTDAGIGTSVGIAVGSLLVIGIVVWYISNKKQFKKVTETKRVGFPNMLP